MFIDTYSNLRKASPVFYRKDGKLTAYSLHCGYQEREENKQETECKQLFHEHGMYHVRYFKYSDTHTVVKRVWEVFETVNMARKFYNSIKFNNDNN